MIFISRWSLMILLWELTRVIATQQTPLMRTVTRGYTLKEKGSEWTQNQDHFVEPDLIDNIVFLSSTDHSYLQPLLNRMTLSYVQQENLSTTTDWCPLMPQWRAGSTHVNDVCLGISLFHGKVPFGCEVSHRLELQGVANVEVYFSFTCW